MGFSLVAPAAGPFSGVALFGEPCTPGILSGVCLGRGGRGGRGVGRPEARARVPARREARARRPPAAVPDRRGGGQAVADPVDPVAGEAGGREGQAFV